ncbi:4'-phosphopantetheinyl transferase family protein [Rubidibacter lacunae]|uniref:4'-phosphopantetheinyl transferase family protein n=1 Tax=Rubidibacter lacunae TaxID=582514 RepID=UPI0008FEF3A0|nr:4'-phosphopantetheinyl transferase superfamily protein [Rubidibacter lacunae]
MECSRQLAETELARQFFSPREAEAIAQLPPEEGQRAFLRMWTLKEARLKATGVGISEGLARVAVDLDHPIALPWRVRVDDRGVDRWERVLRCLYRVRGRMAVPLLPDALNFRT